MNWYKKRHLIAFLIYAVIIVAMVIAARMFTKGMVSSVLFVLAAITALPAAKHGVAFIVVAHFSTLNREALEDLDEHTRNMQGRVVYDLTLSSEKSIFYTPYVYYTENHVYALFLHDSGRVSLEEFQKYFRKILADGGFMPEIHIISNVSEMNKLLEEIDDSQEYNPEILDKMKKQMLIFNV